MKFSVGPFTYTLKIVDQRPVYDGSPCDGLIDIDNEKIIIFTGVRGRRRLNVLLHELRHAWLHHFPHDANEEADCDMAANFAQSAMQDLALQGGTKALDALVSEEEEIADLNETPALLDIPDGFAELRIAPLNIVTPLDIRRFGLAGRAECARCAQTFTDGNIVKGSPFWHDEAKAMVVKRTLFCDGCGHLQSWLEGLDLTGMPSGIPVTEPVFERNQLAIETFLTAHPEAANIVDYA